jgi:GNAT superfamily N-acetyltransferase
LDLAVEALQCVSKYDVMRVETYRQKEGLADRIRVSSIGSTVALRFDDVGYFNRVYGPDQSIFESIPAIEEFYCGGSFGCHLVGPPGDGSGDEAAIYRPGWTVAHRYAWLAGESGNLPMRSQPTGFTIRSPEPSQRRQFLLAYLLAFEAQEGRIPAAVRNMMHLFDRPELDFLMAWHGESLAGVGIWMRCGESALLCAGAALPEFREMGCHAALLDARIRRAAEAGCERIYSWAELGGQSQANMERAGLCVEGTTTTWHYSPKGKV